MSKLAPKGVLRRLGSGVNKCLVSLDYTHSTRNDVDWCAEICIEKTNRPRDARNYKDRSAKIW